VSDAIAFRAIKLITESFVSYYEDPTQPTAREAMVCGATLAGKAFSNTFTAACEALSYPISALFGLSHGASCAITLPLIAELNAGSVRHKFIDLAAYLGLRSPAAVVASIAALCEHATTIPRLRGLGATRADLDRIASAAFQPLLANNPVPLTRDRIVRLLEPQIDNAA
jgi:alcohol dehydrogenase